jgi:hypothetical protein
MLTRSVALLALGLVACAPEARDDEGALLAEIDAVHALVERGAPEERALRRRAVVTLAAIDVPSSLRPARDRCAELYGALVAHDEAYAEVSALLDRYEPVPRAEWPADHPERLRAGYAAAQASTARANRARGPCESARAGLRRDRTVDPP